MLHNNDGSTTNYGLLQILPDANAYTDAQVSAAEDSLASTFNAQCNTLYCELTLPTLFFHNSERGNDSLEREPVCRHKQHHQHSDYLHCKFSHKYTYKR